MAAARDKLSSDAKRLDRLATDLANAIDTQDYPPDFRERVEELREIQKRHEGLAGIAATAQGSALIEILSIMEREMTAELPKLVAQKSSRVAAQATEILLLRALVNGLLNVEKSQGAAFNFMRLFKERFSKRG
jgi:hypothetical protein